MNVTNGNVRKPPRALVAPGVRTPSINEQLLRSAAWHLTMANAIVAQVIKSPRPAELDQQQWDKLRYVTTYVGRGSKVLLESASELANGS